MLVSVVTLVPTPTLLFAWVRTSARTPTRGLAWVRTSVRTSVRTLSSVLALAPTPVFTNDLESAVNLRRDQSHDFSGVLVNQLAVFVHPKRR